MEKKVRKEIKLCNREAREKETERRSDKKESSQGLEDRKGKVEVAKNVLLGAIMLEQILELYMRNSQEIVRNKEGGMWTEEIGRDNVWETAGGYWISGDISWDTTGRYWLGENCENIWDVAGGYRIEGSQDNNWDSLGGAQAWDKEGSHDSNWDSQIEDRAW